MNTCGLKSFFKSFKQLQKLVNQIEYETKILPNEVKEIRAINKKNKDLIKKSEIELQEQFELIKQCWCHKPIDRLQIDDIL